MELNLKFKTEKEYNSAKIWFEFHSSFAPLPDDEFNCLCFTVLDNADADATEHAIEAELTRPGLQGYYFELE